jgi:hypothetical protein
MIHLKKQKATKRSYHPTISLIEHTAKTVASIYGRRIEMKTEDALAEDKFGVRR